MRTEQIPDLITSPSLRPTGAGTRSQHRPERAARALVASAMFASVVFGASLGGCGLNESGRAASLDQHTYYSTVYQPKTITVLDTRDQQEIITIEIPVGSKLATRYYRKQSGNDYRPDLMRWSIHSISHVSASLDNEVAVPRHDGGRLIVMTVREAPELALDAAPPPLQPAAGGVTDASLDGSRGSAPAPPPYFDPAEEAEQTRPAAPASGPTADSPEPRQPRREDAPRVEIPGVTEPGEDDSEAEPAPADSRDPAEPAEVERDAVIDLPQ